MAAPTGVVRDATQAAVQGAAASRSSRPVMAGPPLAGGGAGHSGVGGAVHVYATGFQASPYADVMPAGDGTGTSRGRGAPRDNGSRDSASRDSGSRDAPRKLWHASPGSSGR